jgi:transposase
MVHGIVWQFKMILTTKDMPGLEKWIEKAQGLGISEMTSFANGLERDWDAARNAIVSPFSNGLAEGSVNKLKVIKRVMYGRCSFDTLRTKTLRLEKMHKLN